MLKFLSVHLKKSLCSFIMETGMVVCVLTCFGGVSRKNRLVKDKPKILILSPWITNINSGASMMCRYISNNYLWSYTIETDISAGCLGFYGNLDGQNLVKKICPKLRFCPDEYWTFNCIPQYYAETSSMTIYGLIQLKWVCEHAMWPILNLKFSQGQNR